MRTAAAAIAALVALASSGPARASDTADAVPGHPGLTYFDLARLVVPDLIKTADGASGHTVVAFRHIEGKDMLAPPGDPMALGVPPIQAMPVPGQPNRLIVLIDLGASDANVEEAELLGLFDLAGRPKLLDVVEVGNDRWTAIDTEHAPPMLAPGAPLIVVDSGHSNSNESYDDSEMIFIRNGRFQLIDTRFSYNEQLCGFQRVQESTYHAAPAAGPYRAINVVITETIKLNDDDCGDQTPPKAGVHVYRGTYVWDAAHNRYATRSPRLKAIDAANLKWLKDGR